ncbi:iron/manganese superoxide dismutase C-terminal domain-containing protein [Elsinoe australis]|uniref:Iron/manganese superoxide dismutase C-terminal domain-containing protein n=1 Tax=Elsinoe australis TaxID=40998 RepID=A0A4U7B6M8_9PEZI|nr:iron/manganese superoxide dismutase C-terminal domain-containing protein [Elsinoe australis]
MASKRICRPAGRTLFSLDVQSTRHNLSSPIRRNPQHCQRRTLFEVPPLTHIDTFQNSGIRSSASSRSDRLFSTDGFYIAWTDYQRFLVNQLNYISGDDPEIQSMWPIDIAKRFQRDSAHATLFNYASQAHNNHFFFKGISHVPRPVEDFPSLKENLERDFGSMKNLRDQMIFTAAGMFGVGYVWLVWVRGPMGAGTGQWRVLATYNAGTPYALHQHTDDGALGRGRLQSKDMNNLSTEAAAALQRPRQGAMTAGAFGAHSATGKSEAKRKLGGPQEIFPVLCASVWQHVYLRDHGVGGKKAFLDSWWKFVDWEEVDRLTPSAAKRSNRDSLGYTS